MLNIEHVDAICTCLDSESSVFAPGACWYLTQICPLLPIFSNLQYLGQATVLCFRLGKRGLPHWLHSCSVQEKLFERRMCITVVMLWLNTLPFVCSHNHICFLTLKVPNFWKFTSYCSLKPLWSGMGEVVPARTSLTLHPPSPPTLYQLSRLAL